MKCTCCSSCLRIVRVDYEIESFLYFYCNLCNTVFKMNKSIEKDELIRNKVKENYENKYGKSI